MLLSFTTPVAMACQCASRPAVHEALAAATAVFVGRLDGIEERPPGTVWLGSTGSVVFPSPGWLHFEVETWWKGSGADQVVVLGSGSCGLLPPIGPGQTWVIYATGHDGTLATGLCSRSTATAVDAEVAQLGPPRTRRTLAPWTPGPLETAVADADPARIRAALDAGAAPAIQTLGGRPFEGVLATCRPDLVEAAVTAAGWVPTGALDGCPATLWPNVAARLSAGPDPARAAVGRMLDAAVREGQADRLLAALDAGVPASLLSGGQGSPIQLVAQGGDAATLSALTARGVTLGTEAMVWIAASRSDAVRKTALAWTPAAPDATRALDAARPDPDLIAHLLRCGADARATAALDHAVIEGCEPCVTRLLAAGARATPEGLQAAVLGPIETLVRLLDLGADPNAVPAHAMLPLLTAAQNGRIEAVRVLLARGADVNGRSPSGQVALHGAADQPELVRLLLERGADPTLQDLNGRTPIDEALRFGKSELAAEMRAAAR